MIGEEREREYEKLFSRQREIEKQGMKNVILS
jgi:hypothetical protein